MSATAGDNIGMMEGAYFVGRKELLDWVNDQLKLNLHKVEQCAAGNVYCQLLDQIWPGQVAMHKVKWNAKSDFEFVHNYKVLQQGFEKVGIKKVIDVEKLVKAKYQDNLEFLQWTKSLWDKNYNGAEYDAVERRKGQDVAFMSQGGNQNAARIQKAATKAPSQAIPQQKKIPPSKVENQMKEQAQGNQQKPSKQSHDLQQKIQQLEQQIQEQEDIKKGLENEREFYFKRVCQITQLLEGYPDQNDLLVRGIQKLMDVEQADESTVSKIIGELEGS